MPPSDIAGRSAAYEVESERGRDVRRELAQAIVGARLRPARAAADAHEPRGDLPAADDHRTNASPRRPTRAVTYLLAIAGRELRSYFASPIAYIVVGLFALIFGCFFYTILSFFAQQSHAAWAAWAARRR